MTLAPDDPRHGTTHGYRTHHCRCDDCRAGNAARAKERRLSLGYVKRSRADADDPYDSTDPAGTFDHPAWMATAPCVGLTHLFFPGRGESPAEAKAVCATCPIRAECLDYALDHGVRHGVWGGESERARRRIRKLRVEAA